MIKLPESLQAAQRASALGRASFSVNGDRYTIGRSGEALAAETVVADGFRILWRNVRIGPLELDLVAKKDDLVIIVEVRTRHPDGYEGPLASVSWTKRRLLLRASRGLWRRRLHKMVDVRRVRIDVIAITSAGSTGESHRVEWIRGAITEQD